MKELMFDKKWLKKDLVEELRAIGMPVGPREVIAGKIAENISKWVQKRGAVREKELWKKVAIEAKKYNFDLSYVYKIRGKII